jgi:hypothetical protein
MHDHLIKAIEGKEPGDILGWFDYKKARTLEKE